MRVLFLNDTSLMSGAERCLLDLLAELDGEVDPLVACPPGPLFDAVAALEVPVTPTPAVTASLRLHPLHSVRALAGLARAAAVVRRIAARERVDLIHANTLRAGLIAAAARRLGGPPFVAFIHDALDDERVARMTSRAIRSQASLLLANSAYSAACFGLAADDPRCRVVFNPIDLAAFDPARQDRAARRAGLGLEPADLVLAVVGQITPWKGQLEAVQALVLLRHEHPRARLLIVGEAKFVARSTRYDNRAYLAEVRRLVADCGLTDDVCWLGERSDVPAVLAAVDVVLVPSWAEPFGRVVVEAMAMGCLVAATAVGGPAEVIDDGVDGLLIAPRDPARWAQRISATLADDVSLHRIRRAAPRGAARFDRARCARAVLAAYGDVLD